MKEFLLRRNLKSRVIETAGMLSVYGEFPFAVCMEPPWRDNHHDISCIPDGHYTLKPYKRKSGVWAWEVTNVPNRTDILLHSGNFLEDTKGCILVAESFERLNNKNAVVDSDGYKEFIALCDPTKETEAQLFITW